MIKHEIDSHATVYGAVRVQPLVAGPVAVAAASASQIGQTDCYKDGVLVGCIHWYEDGTNLPHAEVKNDVIHLHCNQCQNECAGQILSAAEPYVYFRSVTDAGLHCGKDPFERPGPIQF